MFHYLSLWGTFSIQTSTRHYQPPRKSHNIRVHLPEQASSMEHIEIMLQGAIVERDDLYKVLDEDKLRGEMGHRYQAEVLILK